ncbi:hypothetical protein ACNA6I_01300 [Rossellomorea sp. FS2]|uniref:hypothetical protein n=1 Tax=Rossellomorea sp. FS2 TaxID=3391447 RepID=UPI003A4E1B9F
MSDVYTVRGEEVTNKADALRALCITANYHCLPIHELWCYEGVCEKFDITPEDYYNDTESLSEEHIRYAGWNNWKPKGEDE